MAVQVKVTLNPVDTSKVDAALARIQSKAKGVDFGGGARSIEKLSRPLGKITGQATDFEKSLQASNARVLAFGASVVVINKLSEAFGSLVRNTIKVEATFAKIGIILGGTNKQLQDFGNGIFDVARKTATSFDDVAEGALELARQGLGVEESLSRVETALKLVRVAGVDSQQAVSGLTAAIKGFQGAGETVVSIADKLAEVDTKFAVSTEDLINGLERASASARVAGVSFDELLGLVTTVQERTQRGGAVIGNAFKTIFARLGRTDTLSSLESLGISVQDAEGNVRSAVPLFKDLAVLIDSLGIKSEEAGEVIQKVAGVRQRDILISLIEDLNSGQSQFASVLEKAAGATGKLDQKNEALNKTLEALINNLVVGGQKLSSVLGELGFSDAAKDILKLFSSVVNGITDLLQGDSVGAKFAQGIVKGIGSILTGPGIALVGAIFTKLFIDLAKFGGGSLKQLLGINKAADLQNTLQKSVLQTLLQNESIQREILALEGNKVAQEQLLLKIYNQQAAALARVQKTAAAVTPALFKGGLRGGEAGISKPAGRASEGYVAAESRDVSRGVGGAPSSAKVVSIPNFAFGGGKRGTMVANTSEYVVPNYAGGGDAIFNQDMVKTMGLPDGAKKLNAAGGFIPNFAKFNDLTASGNRFQDTKTLLRASADPKFRPPNIAGFGSLSNEETKAIIARGKQTRGATAKQTGARAAAKKKKTDETTILDARPYSYLVPQFNFKKSIRQSNPFKFKGINGSFSLRNLNIRGPKIPGGVDEAGNPEDEFLENNIRKSLVDQSVKYGNILSKQVGGNNIKPAGLNQAFRSGGTRGAFGALRGAVGAAFEVSTAKALGIRQAAVEKSGADFDITKSNKKLGALFGAQGRKSIGDFKVSDSSGNIKSFARKIALKEGKLTKSAAGGYIPNFARGALDEAVAREQAAGLPLNQIRINQSGKLRNSQNPGGIAVTNTRDEPTGRIPNFAAGGRSTPATPGGSSDGGFGGGLIAASTGLYFLSTALGNAESTFGKLVSKVALAASALTTLSLLKGPVENIGAKLSGFGTQIATFNPQNPGKRAGLKGGLGRGIARVGGALPGIGAAVAIGAVLAPLVLELTKTKTGFERLNEELKNVDLKGLAEGSKEVQTAFLNTLIAEKERRITVADTTTKTGIKKETLDEIFTAAAKRVGKETGFKDKEVLKSSIAALDEQTVKDLIRAAQDTNPVEIITSGGAMGGVQGSFTSEETTLRANDLLDSLIGAIKDNIEETADLAEATAKATREGEFGIGAVTGGKAKKDFKENIDQGRFAAGGFDTIKQLEPTTPGGVGATIFQDGDLSAIRGKELDLAEAVTTVRKVGLENEIALKKFLVEKAKEEFKITEEYVKSIKDATVFSAKQKEFIEGQVKAGASLLSIQAGLTKAGIELSDGAKVDFDLAVGKAETQQEILNNKLEEVELQQKINDLNKPQGFSAGISKGLGSLDDDIAFFRDELGENIPLKFSDNLGSAMQEAVSGAKDLDDALSDAGRNFLGFIRDAFLQQAASQFTSGLFGGGGDGQKTSGLLSGAVDGVKGFFGGGKASGATGATGAAGGAEAKSGGVGGFLSGIFGGGGGGGVLGSTPSNPMFVKEVGNMKLGLGQEGADKAAGGVAEQLTGEGSGSEGIFSRLKSTLMESFGGLKNIFGNLFGGLKDSFGTMFKGLTSNLGSLFSGLGGGGGGGGMGGLFTTVLGAFGFATGGPVGFANGGSVGSTDTVPAMLTPGEFVVKKSSVDKYGTDFLSNLNRGMLPMQGFQNGGTVSPVSSESGTGGAGAGQVNNNSDFTFNIQDGKVNQEGGQSSTEDQQEFATRVRSAVTTVIQEESRSGGTLNYLYKK